MRIAESGTPIRTNQSIGVGRSIPTAASVNSSRTIRKPSSQGYWAYAGVRLRRFCVCHSAVILDCLLDARCGFLQVFKVHRRMELDMGIESLKPRFRHGGYLRRILQVEEDEPRSLAIVFGKIGCLRLQVGKNGVDGLGQAAIADRGIPRLNRD